MGANSGTDTPRTDNECGLLVLATGKMVKQGAHGLTVPADFARQLERELTQAKAELAEISYFVSPGAGRTLSAMEIIKELNSTSTYTETLEEEIDKIKTELATLRAECERLKEGAERMDWLEELTKRLATWQGASGMVEKWLETDICIRGPNVNIYIRDKHGQHIRGGTGSCIRLAIDSAREQQGDCQ